MDDSIVAMFVEDTREYLADIETDLLDIEEAGPDFDLELVNKVFRTAHSIKGSSAFLGLNKIRDLSHKIENVLDMIRGRELTPSPAVLNVVLAAFDQLRDMIEDIDRSEEAEIASHVRALTAIVAGSLPEERRALVTTLRDLALPGGRVAFQVSEHELVQARKGGNFLYLVEYDLIHDVQKQGKSPFDLMKFLEKSGLILDCRVDFDAVGTLDETTGNRIPFYVLYASILEQDLVKAIFQLPEAFIHLIPSEAPGTAAAAPVSPVPPISHVPPVPAPSSSPAAATASQSHDLDDLEAAFDAALASADSGASVAPIMAPTSAPPPRLPEGVELRGPWEAGVMTIHGRATVERAQDLKAALLEALQRHASLELNLADVEAVDLTFLQLLWGAWLSAKARGVSIRCGAMSGPLHDALSLAGFDNVIPAQHGLDSFPGQRG